MYLEQVHAYVDEIKLKADAEGAEASRAARRVVGEANDRAKDIVNKAHEDAERILREADEERDRRLQEAEEAMREVREKRDSAEKLMRRAQELIADRAGAGAPAVPAEPRRRSLLSRKGGRG